MAVTCIFGMHTVQEKVENGKSDGKLNDTLVDQWLFVLCFPTYIHTGNMCESYFLFKYVVLR